MSRPNPPRGASRSPRPAGKTASTGRGGRRTTKATSKNSSANKSSIKKGRLILGLLLLAGLIALILMLIKKPAPAVATVPPALAEEKLVGVKQEPSKAPAKPTERFAFYELLPNQKVLPTRSIESRPVPSPKSDQGAGIEGSFWLQAGAFRDSTEANARRAAISQLGLPARIQSQRDNGTTLLRVLVGPFNQMERRDLARTKLAEAGLDAIPASAPAASAAPAESLTP